MRDSGPTTDPSANQNAGEQDSCKEEMAGVFGGCERTRGRVWVARVRVEWDVLDVVMS